VKGYVDIDGYVWKKKKPTFDFKGVISYGGRPPKVYEWLGMIEVENHKGFVCTINQLWGKISLHKKIHELLSKQEKSNG
jgi:hypothetical protein